MKNTDQLRDLGQGLWLDGITRTMLDDGSLPRTLQEFSVTGLSADPASVGAAIGAGAAYDEAIRAKAQAGLAGEELVAELVLEDLRRAALLLQAAHDSSAGLDGWVSMAPSPLLARDTAGCIAAAAQRHRLAARPNLLVQIPGTPEGLPAIEESIFAGIPVDVTLLFSAEQYRDGALAYLRGIERRLEAGRDAKVGCVASVSISRWDASVAGRVAPELRNRLGIAVGRRAYRVYRELLTSPRWRRLAAAGARPQRLVWVDTTAEDEQLSASWYVQALVAPDTIDRMSEPTLVAFAAHGRLHGATATDAGSAEACLARFARAGIDVDALARQLQLEGLAAAAGCWEQLLVRVAEKSTAARALHPLN